MKKYKYFTFLLIFLLIVLIVAGVWGVYTYSQQTTLLNNRVADLEATIEQQRKDRDRIRDLWEDQAASNDVLVLNQQDLIDSVNNYQAEIKRSIRFVNGQPDLLPTINEQRLLQQEGQIKASLDTIDQRIEQNAKEKQAAKDEIDAIYLRAMQDQSNRANPRDGVR